VNHVENLVDHKKIEKLNKRRFQIGLGLVAVQKHVKPFQSFLHRTNLIRTLTKLLYFPIVNHNFTGSNYIRQKKETNEEENSVKRA
jgi:hypothetical protein